MLGDCIIRLSYSPFLSPLLLLKKKDGTWCFYVDYGELNAHTVKNEFSIPIVDDILDELHEATVFSKIDLKSGYHQIRVKEEDVPKTTFRTHHRHYEFLVMLFGRTNVTVTFEALMNHIFWDCLCKFVLVFFDDILINSAGEQVHYNHPEAIVKVLRLHKLYAKRSECFSCNRR